ncbi:MAG: hypothetical protein KF729_32115 [Sandaracinaceae bacterium]|nr:hypothetical protein [Sandaracinaceae bacterium]
MQRFVATLAFTALAACEPRSSAPAGEHPAIRYLLPDDFVEVMEGADRLVVHSFAAGQPPGAARAFPCGERLSRPIVGRVEERDPREIRHAAQDVYEALLEVGGSWMCSEPELGLRFERGDRSIELTISEDCHLAWIFVDDEPYRASISIAPLRDRTWPGAAAALRRRCGVDALPPDTWRYPVQYHGGTLCAGICGEPTM